MSKTTQTPAARVSKPYASNPGRALGPGTAPESKSDDVGSVVDMEIPGTDESKKALDKAQSLGALLNFENMKDVAEALGKSEHAARNMPIVDIANAAGLLGFSIGYAVCKHDRVEETESVLSKSRGLILKLEKAEGKLTKAEKHVWDARHLTTIVYALAVTQHNPTDRNIRAVLDAFPKMPPAQREEIMEAAKSIFHDRGARKLIAKIRKDVGSGKRPSSGAAQNEE